MNIFLGNPPENIRQWIINDYNRRQEEKKHKVPLCFEAVDAGATITLFYYGSNFNSATFQTSTDGQNWSDCAYETGITLTNAGDKVYFRAKEDNTAIERNSSNYLHFVTPQEAKRVNVSGNVMSLLAPEFKDLVDLSTIRAGNPGRCQFYRLFQNCKSISDCRNLILPATALAGGCYQSMFDGCTNLTQAPALPATTLAGSCYYSMFQGCSNLTQAPALLATTLAESCYYSMFSGCSKLAQAPELPATTLASNCYNSMFQGCSKLAQAPELPVTALASGCYYQMFSGCSSLTQAPALPATKLAGYCYNSMFYGCSKLAQAPELPATTLADDCYSYMFRRCASLTQAPIIKTYTAGLVSCTSMLDMFDLYTGSWGQLTTCVWNDLTISEVESMVLNETIFGYDNPGDSVRINITCKDGSGVAYFDSKKYSWVFEY